MTNEFWACVLPAFAIAIVFSSWYVMRMKRRVDKLLAQGWTFYDIDFLTGPIMVPPDAFGLKQTTRKEVQEG